MQDCVFTKKEKKRALKQRAKHPIKVHIGGYSTSQKSWDKTREYIYIKRASTSLISLTLLYLYYYARFMSSLTPARACIRFHISPRTRFHFSARTRFHFSPCTRFHISARTCFHINTRTRFHISARALHLIAHACHSERSSMSSSPLALVKWTAEGLRTSHTKAFY